MSALTIVVGVAPMTNRLIMACLEPLAYDRIYGAFFVRPRGIVPTTKEKELVQRWADRDLRGITH